MNISLPSERLRNLVSNINIENKLRTHNKNQDINFAELDDLPPQNISTLEKQIQFAKESPIASGMSQTLKLMRNKGLLGNNSIEYIGRNKDKLLHKELEKFET